MVAGRDDMGGNLPPDPGEPSGGPRRVSRQLTDPATDLFDHERRIVDHLVMGEGHDLEASRLEPGDALGITSKLLPGGVAGVAQQLDDEEPGPEEGVDPIPAPRQIGRAHV